MEEFRTFKLYAPGQRGNAPRRSAAEWEKHKPLLTYLHAKGLTRLEIKQRLTELGFEVTMGQLLRKATAWGLTSRPNIAKMNEAAVQYLCDENAHARHIITLEAAGAADDPCMSAEATDLISQSGDHREEDLALQQLDKPVKSQSPRRVCSEEGTTVKDESTYFVKQSGGHWHDVHRETEKPENSVPLAFKTTRSYVWHFPLVPKCNTFDFQSDSWQWACPESRWSQTNQGVSRDDRLMLPIYEGQSQIEEAASRDDETYEAEQFDFAEPVLRSLWAGSSSSSFKRFRALTLRLAHRPKSVTGVSHSNSSYWSGHMSVDSWKLESTFGPIAVSIPKARHA